MKHEIHSAATLARQNGILDHEVYDAEIIEAFLSSKHEGLKCYMDIPISCLVALSPRNFYHPGASWRDAIRGLHCEDWDKHRDSIVRYFTSDLRDNLFPAPNSSQELRIGFAGSAIYCKLGNHRAAAAKAWLAFNHGEEASYKQASCFYRPVIHSLKQLMVECIKNGSTLSVGYYPKEVYNNISNGRISFLVFVEHTSFSHDLYALDSCSEDLQRVHPDRNLLCRLLKNDFYSRCLRLDFKEVPVKLMELMLDESWHSKFIEVKSSQ
jgi:hypothetical protein